MFFYSFFLPHIRSILYKHQKKRYFIIYRQKNHGNPEGNKKKMLKKGGIFKLNAFILNINHEAIP